MSCSDLTTQVLVDDYKLYATGLVQTLEVYDGNGGEKLSSAEKMSKSQVGYRLAWMNATATGKTVKVKAASYDSNDKLISETDLGTVVMAPGADGVVTGLAKNQGAKLTIYLEEVTYIPPEDVTETPDSGATDTPGENPSENPGENPSVTPGGDSTENPGTDGSVTPDGTNPKGEEPALDRNVPASKGNAVLWIVIGVVAAAAAGAGVYIILKKKKTTPLRKM